jgi:putative SOS response-associated peptidase YedK
MCGRYTLSCADMSLVELLRLSIPPRLEARYNIAPTQQVPVLRSGPEAKTGELEMVRWGLIPGWAKDPAIGNRLINARSETAAQKPAFRAAFRQRRCLVPADGFYEWQKLGRRKQPHYIRMRQGGPFAMAGLWERWQDPEGTAIESCTLLTTAANELLRPLHDRMPVILSPDEFSMWLDPEITDAARLKALLRPYDPTEMAAHPVSTLVNSPANDSPACVEPVS